MTYIVYQIICIPSNKSYVGITLQKLGARWCQHRSDAKHRRRTLLGRAIRRYGAEAFTINQLREEPDFVSAGYAERAEIARLGTLCPGGYNLTIGGDGLPGSTRSALTRKRISRISSVRSAETKQKISDSLRGRKPHLTPEQREARSVRARAYRTSDETRAKMSFLMKGKKRGPLSEESAASFREKIRAKMAGRSLSDEHRAKLSASRIGMKFSDEHRKNIGNSSRGRTKSPEQRERQRQAILGRKHSPESIERMRVAAKLRPQHQHGRKLSSAHKAKLSASLKAAYAAGRR